MLHCKSESKCRSLHTSTEGKLESYLKFLKPHQKQYKYFSKKREFATSFLKASPKIPNLNLIFFSFSASQFETTWVTLSQYFRSGSSLLLQSRKLVRQDTVMDSLSLLHSCLQQENCRPMDDRYHTAPTIWTINTNHVIDLAN